MLRSSSSHFTHCANSGQCIDPRNLDEVAQHNPTLDVHTIIVPSNANGIDVVCNPSLVSWAAAIQVFQVYTRDVLLTRFGTECEKAWNG